VYALQAILRQHRFGRLFAAAMGQFECSQIFVSQAFHFMSRQILLVDANNQSSEAHVAWLLIAFQTIHARACWRRPLIYMASFLSCAAISIK
jgi:hypothetical protein